jgi:hypothetical protein
MTDIGYDTVSIYATEYAISERTAAYPLKKLSLKAF